MWSVTDLDLEHPQHQVMTWTLITFYSQDRSIHSLKLPKQITSVAPC